MLHDFLSRHRDILIARCRERVMHRRIPKFVPASGSAVTDHGIVLFLDQLITALQAEQNGGSLRRRFGVPDPDAQLPDTSGIGATAMQHGLDLARKGVTVDQVVHDYGDLCQVITELACETRTSFGVIEFKTLNFCLDQAIANAVSEFSYQHEAVCVEQNMELSDEQARTVLQQLQGHLHTATLAMDAISTGNVGVSGVTANILDGSLASMRTLITQALGNAAPAAGAPARRAPVSLRG